MIRLIGAELFKLRTTRMYLGLLAAGTALVVAVTAVQLALGADSSLSIEGAAEVIETEADLRSVLDVTGIAALFTLVLGATAVAGEHRHHTAASMYLLTPARSRVVIAKLVGYVIAGALFGIVVEAAAAVVTVGWLVAMGAPVPFGSTVAAGLALTPVATGLAAAFGVGLSAAVPNQLGAVLVAVGWVMLAEQLLAGLVPGLAEWLPFSGAGAAVTGQATSIGVAAGMALFLGYIVALTGVGLEVTRRRDVG
ncbi:MAG TPA: hypothetical protein VFZ37_14705 [Jiangellaceae bacterium]